MSQNKFLEEFLNPKKRFHSGKFLEFLHIYDRYFHKFKGKSPIILEIGVKLGGSLELYNDYFDNECTIYGIDIKNNNEIKRLKSTYNNISVYFGDQGNKNFWKQLKEEKNLPRFDIIIDDGGHKMHQQITTFQELFDSHLKDGGVYLCEDTHTSYWDNWGGGFRKPTSFIEFSKKFIDILHIGWMVDGWKKKGVYTGPAPVKKEFEIRKKLDSIHFHGSIVVFEKNNIPTHKTREGENGDGFIHEINTQKPRTLVTAIETYNKLYNKN